MADLHFDTEEVASDFDRAVAPGVVRTAPLRVKRRAKPRAPTAQMRGGVEVACRARLLVDTRGRPVVEEVSECPPLTSNKSVHRGPNQG